MKLSLKDYRGFTGAEKLALVRLHCYSIHACMTYCSSDFDDVSLFFLHTHADEAPVVSLTVKIRHGFVAVWTLPTSALGKVRRFKVVLFQVTPRRRRVKRYLFQPYVQAKYFSSLEPGRTYEVRVRMKLTGRKSFGPYGNLTVAL